VIGTYDPIPKAPPGGKGKPIKDIRLDVSRAKYWLGVGAQPSDPAWRLMALVGLLEPRWGIVQRGIANKDTIKPRKLRKGTGLLSAFAREPEKKKSKENKEDVESKEDKEAQEVES